MIRHIFTLISFGMILLCVDDACGQGHGGPGRGYGRRDEGRRDSSSKDDRSTGGRSRKGYRFKTAHERLPKGIPDWFVEKDANHDGQVMMAEFAVRWSETLVAEFVRFDLNGDGIVTPKECLSARAAGAVYSGGSAPTASVAKPASDKVTSTAAGEAPGPSSSDTPSSTQVRAASSPPTETAAKPESEIPPAAADVEIPEAYLKHAVSYVGMYDTDGDGALTSDEWEKMRKNPQAADRNSDGRITPQEYALSVMKR